MKISCPPQRSKMFFYFLAFPQILGQIAFDNFAWKVAGGCLIAIASFLFGEMNQVLGYIILSAYAFDTLWGAIRAIKTDSFAWEKFWGCLGVKALGFITIICIGNLLGLLLAEYNPILRRPIVLAMGFFIAFNEGISCLKNISFVFSQYGVEVAWIDYLVKLFFRIKELPKKELDKLFPNEEGKPDAE